jgi:hypothetical protein
MAIILPRMLSFANRADDLIISVYAVGPSGCDTLIGQIQEILENADHTGEGKTLSCSIARYTMS